MRSDNLSATSVSDYSGATFLSLYAPAYDRCKKSFLDTTQRSQRLPLQTATKHGTIFCCTPFFVNKDSFVADEILKKKNKKNTQASDIKQT